jgi:hypothetical protein
MKNIHLLPTDNQYKGSISLTPDGRLSTNVLIIGIPHHLYITSDAEIKDEDYCVHTNQNSIIKIGKGEGKLMKGHLYLKKIILTTDQDLIAEGVQDIDDEFLDWFVENPNCDFVEVQKWFDGLDFLEYKIIIPKEEPKKETISFEFFDKEKADSITNEGQKIVRELQNITKQETLEEVSFRLYPRLINDPYNPMEDDNKEDRDTWIEGAKWGSENTNEKYSEEEVIKLLIYCKDRFGGSGLEDYTPDSEVKEWFERVKKK